MPPLPAPPLRPSPRQESLGLWLLRVLAPRLAEREQPAPPPELGPAEALRLPRRQGTGSLAATWYPAVGAARGAVLLLHPWVWAGKAYFHRGGRVAALREAGWAALALDLPGFGASGPPSGFYDREVEDALEWLAERNDGRPLAVWGVSSGGYWAHPVLARRPGVAAACFEDVSPHLLEWSWRASPLGRPFYLVFRTLLGAPYRFLDMRRHAAAMPRRPVAYVSGERDGAVRPEDTRELARLAGGRCRIVAEAPHLGAIKIAPEEVIGLALETFEKGAA